jgi:hypothetical protein
MMHVGAGSNRPLHTHVTSVPCYLAIQSDLGVTIVQGATSSSVTNWADQTGNGHNFSQATPGQQPQYKLNGLNGYPTILFDGINDQVNALFNPPPPGTTTFFSLIVFKLLATPPSNGVIYSDTAGTGFITYILGGTNNVTEYNGVSANQVAITLASWKRVESYYSNSTNDYTKAGAVRATGTNALNNDPLGTFFIGGLAANFLNMELAALSFYAGLPTAQELTAYQNAVQRKYGTAVGI